MKKIILFILLNISIFSNYEVKNNKVYYRKLLRNSDVKSYKSLGDYYSIYYDEEFEGVDYSSFENLDHGYSKDKTNVYYYGKKLEGADVQTFRVYEYTKTIKGITCDSEDKKYYYYVGKTVKNKRK